MERARESTPLLMSSPTSSDETESLLSPTDHDVVVIEDSSDDDNDDNGAANTSGLSRISNGENTSSIPHETGSLSNETSVAGALGVNPPRGVNFNERGVYSTRNPDGMFTNSHDASMVASTSTAEQSRRRVNDGDSTRDIHATNWEENGDRRRLQQSSDFNRLGQNGDPNRLGQNGDPNRLGQNGDPNRLGQNGDPHRLGQDGDPSRLGQNGDPNRLGQDGDPNRLGQDGDPNRLGQNGDPNRLGQDGDPNRLGQNGDPNRLGQNRDPSRLGQNGDPNRLGQDGDPNRLGQNGDPNRLGQDGDPNRLGHNGDPNRLGQNDHPNRLLTDQNEHIRIRLVINRENRQYSILPSASSMTETSGGHPPNHSVGLESANANDLADSARCAVSSCQITGVGNSDLHNASSRNFSGPVPASSGIAGSDVVRTSLTSSHLPHSSVASADLSHLGRAGSGYANLGVSCSKAPRSGFAESSSSRPASSGIAGSDVVRTSLTSSHLPHSSVASADLSHSGRAGSGYANLGVSCSKAPRSGFAESSSSRPASSGIAGSDVVRTSLTSSHLPHSSVASADLSHSGRAGSGYANLGVSCSKAPRSGFAESSSSRPGFSFFDSSLPNVTASNNFDQPLQSNLTFSQATSHNRMPDSRYHTEANQNRQIANSVASLIAQNTQNTLHANTSTSPIVFHSLLNMLNNASDDASRISPPSASQSSSTSASHDAPHSVSHSSSPSAPSNTSPVTNPCQRSPESHLVSGLFAGIVASSPSRYHASERFRDSSIRFGISGSVPSHNAPVATITTPDTPHDSPVVQQAATAAGIIGHGNTPAATPKHECSQDQFKTTKRRRSPTPTDRQSDDDDEQVCPICFEAWTTSGGHRLVSLKCGHLFGQNCIMKWLNTKKTCPQCNARARRLDIRCLYARKIRAVDTTERDEALRKLEGERTLRGKAEMETAEIRLQHRLRTAECERLRAELDAYKSAGCLQIATKPRPQVATQESAATKYTLEHTISFGQAGGCRVCAYSGSNATLVISQCSSNPIFPGFGFRKLNCLDFKTSQNITLHSKSIRDACFHSTKDDGILLSCSLDKTLKLTNILTNNILHVYTTPQPIWSCTFNRDDQNLFYAGLQNGTVLEYDIRNTSDCVRKLDTQGSQAPVVSLQYVPANPQSAFRPGGLLVGQLDKITFHERHFDEFRPHYLPLEARGSLTSLRLEPVTRHFVASFRPNVMNPMSRHVLCAMRAPRGSCSADILHTFVGGSVQRLLSRSLIAIGRQPGHMIIYTSDESDNSASVWDASTQTLSQKLEKHGRPILDMCAFTRNHTDYLATLTDNTLRVFKDTT